MVAAALPPPRTSRKKGQLTVESTLTGTAAIVTGASSGIGAATARMVTRPRHTAIGELWIMPTDQV
jgi:hypothetical protein